MSKRYDNAIKRIQSTPLNPELLQAAKDYCDNRAARLRWEAIEKRIKTEILAAHVFMTNPEYSFEPSERVTDTLSDFLMYDDDSKRYFALCAEAEIAAGAANPEKVREGYYPSGQFRKAEQAAQELLLDLAVELHGLEQLSYQNMRHVLNARRDEACALVLQLIQSKASEGGK